MSSPRPGVIAAVGLGCVSAGIIFGFVGSSCTGGASATSEPKAWALAVDRGLFDATWPMEVVDDDARVRYEEPDYVALTFHRDIRDAVDKVAGQDGLAAARVHADAAALYRQAALAAGTSYVEYFDAPLGQAYDPQEKVHLILVGKTLRNDMPGAKAQIDAVKALGEDSVVAPWAAPWLSMHDGGSWPPDLSGVPFQLPEVEVGEWPEVSGARPTYLIKEQAPGTHDLSIDDPTLLVQLALWHDAASMRAAGDQSALLEVYGARYRMPVEGPVADRSDLPLELRFGSDYLHPRDAAFMAAATGTEGLPAIDSFKGESFTAAVADACRDASGAISAEKAVDLVNEIRKAYKEQQSAKRDGSHQSHAIFADVAVAGLYRNLAILAELGGDRETSGKLRIAAKDMGERDAAAAPEGLLSLTAWDADNQYTLRGLEIIHQQARRAPSLEVVRTALDLLAIRVGRTRGGGGTPGM